MAKKQQETKSSRISKATVMQSLLEFFRLEPNKSFNYKQLAHALQMKNNRQKELVAEVLFDLEFQGFICQTDFGSYKLNSRQSYVTGRIDRQMVEKKNYLVPDDGNGHILIPERAMNTAMNGDYVKVVLKPFRNGKEQEGEVVEVIKRARTEFVGTLEMKHHYAFLNVDRRQLSHDIFIPIDKTKDAKNGQKCIARIIEWEDKDQNPIGEIVDVLGNQGDNNTEMHAILAEFGLPYKYPEEVEKAANEISDQISDEEIAKRRDMRNITTFTIDPKDAKDFDDALSIRRLNNGNWEVGVHIADVTYYVQPGSIIDKEAIERATSVYLVDRTIPMLPERLCNNLCSLRQDEDKLTYSVLFEMDEKANILNYEILRTIIRSNRRFAYEEAQEIIETQKGEYCEEILQLDKLAKILREKRFKNGAISFERTEVRFNIDENGKPISVYFKESKDANKLIEEFMLLANRTVATHIGKHKHGEKEKTFVYRVHDVPNPDKLNNFAAFITKFGYKLKTTGKNSEVAKAINQLLDEAEGKKEENLIETLAVRSMAKAIYTTTNIGHYGLAFDYYTHFTSPIRRYPDMMVHRLLTHYLNGGKSVDPTQWEEWCDHSSDREQLAANAERASIKYKQVEYMSERIGQIYEGVISGVTEWGLYVEINENKCEGMVPLRDLEDDYYTFDEKNYCIIGRHFHKTYQLGDPVTVRIARADLMKKQLDLDLVKEKEKDK